MKNNLFKRNQASSFKSILSLVIFANLFISNNAFADHVALANKPLVEMTTSDVLPNLMFVLDNSGSMGRNFTPDWVNSYEGTSGNVNTITLGFTNPTLSKNPAFNSQFYNPNISYTPGVDYNGTSLGSQTTFTSVKNDGYIGTGTTNLVGNANYYAYIPGEFCTTKALTTCTTLAAASKDYPYPATVRWCDTAANALTANPAPGKCEAIRKTGFLNLRTPTPDSTIVFTGTTSSSVKSIKVNGNEILATSTTATTNTTTIASRVATAINSCFTTTFGQCTTSGYRAVASGNSVTITSPIMDNVKPVVVFGSGTMVATPTSFTKVRGGNIVYVDIVSTVGSYTAPGSSVKGTERSDCSGTVCTYNEEMTNYANWYTYYRTRIQGMKSAASLAFKGIDNRYRVGFYTINSPTTNYIPIAKFETGTTSQKQKWYSKLFSIVPGGGTPLRSALVTVGRIFAGKKPIGTSDPMEYACQPNFTLMTTDGYWNTDANTAVVGVDGTQIQDLDGGSTPRPQNEGKIVTNSTLSDAAKYYYDTDIRTTAFGNCTGALNANVCGDAATETSYQKQRMSTLTLGLGADGTLQYDEEYKTQTSGDYFDIKSSAAIKDWPVPVADTETAIDDLWHAAVNANGTYFSAKDPQQLTESLKRALLDIQAKAGTGSAASASSLQPTSGDNYNYLASYETVRWTGNLERHSVDLTTLKTLPKAEFCVEDVAAESCPTTTSLVSEVVGSGSQFYCKATGLNQAACDALGSEFVLTGSDCKKAVAAACTGQMSDQVATDTRKIYFNSGGSLTSFKYSALNSTQKQFFEKTWLSSHLSQWSSLNTTQQTAAEKDGIVEFLRGQQALENRPNNTAINQIFRYREATLGDITESQPAYIAAPVYDYTDAGYSAFKTAQLTRAGTVYVGANDGMLHAFEASTMIERWAFVPTPVIPNMWKLADSNYATNHANFVNGDPVIGEVSVGGVWKTVLVGGLNGGGRGYYALDITDPTNPKLLWEFTSADDANLGYTFGAPVITKLNDGTWVALLSSGYDNGILDKDGVTANSPTGDGSGRLYVLDFNTSSASKKALKTFKTGVGSSTTPSGLAPIAAFVDKLKVNNLATNVYGGDLEGNLWRFDINATSGAAPLKLATLKGPSKPQPITTVPQLGVVDKQKVIFVGTGKYLELIDLDPNPDTQTIYALADTGTYMDNPRGNTSGFVQQTIDKVDRTVKTSVVNAFSTKSGWWVDLPDSGERVNIDPYLVNGVLLIPTIVPASSSCSPGGYGWFNYFNYKTGGQVPGATTVSEKLNAPAVGFNLVYDKDGKPVVTVVESDDPTPKEIKNSGIADKGGDSRTTLFNKNTDGTYGTKSIWRELNKR